MRVVGLLHQGLDHFLGRLGLSAVAADGDDVAPVGEVSGVHIDAEARAAEPEVPAQEPVERELARQPLAVRQTDQGVAHEVGTREWQSRLPAQDGRSKRRAEYRASRCRCLRAHDGDHGVATIVVERKRHVGREHDVPDRGDA